MELVNRFQHGRQRMSWPFKYGVDHQRMELAIKERSWPAKKGVGQQRMELANNKGSWQVKIGVGQQRMELIRDYNYFRFLLYPTHIPICS
ncbi:hypothetical protein JTE90_003532 [Oedothorax gibbosus]|uniref:Uncharacterized protein n=1 Tax=Oedothorax gibbosus TaxID=931172 RepID=A0AAV6UP20_9ARAC|nr:hypothetical protein JTE90_003532 [Oedothorax gibbosus]